MQRSLSLYTAAQVRELDRLAIHSFNIPGFTLMQRAGMAAFKTLVTHWPFATRLQIFCGSGNNGGDGYAIATLAHLKGFQVQVIQVGEVTQLKGDALKAYEQAQAAGVVMITFDAQLKVKADVLVDALLGTGLRGGVKSPYKEAITLMNESHVPIFAIDIPSGLCADTGQVLGLAIQAQITLTFIGLKPGLFTADGAQYAGKVLYDDLNLPAAVFSQLTTDIQLIDAELLRKNFLPARQANTHKGQYGHVLAIGGNQGMPGSICMAAIAAMRVGAGLVTVVTHPVHAAFIPLLQPELMAQGVAEDKITQLEPLLKRASVILIGPGLGCGSWAKALLQAALAAQKPIIIDADALNLFIEMPKPATPQWILTPHPGEAARLLQTSTGVIQQERFAAAKALQQNYGGVVILKGAGTLVCSAQAIKVNTTGNPGMATAGMGDVLAGVLAGLVAQGMNLFAAAQLGVWLHGYSADLIAQVQGQRGLLASDLFPVLQRLANKT